MTLARCVRSMRGFASPAAGRVTCTPRVTRACFPSVQVDEIFGTIQEVYFSVKPAEGVNAPSFKVGDKLYINPEKLLPLARFLPGAQGGGGGGKGKGGKGAPFGFERLPARGGAKRMRRRV